MKSAIIDKVVSIHKKYRLDKADVSAHTKSAISITKEWQKECEKINFVKSEVEVIKKGEKFDIVDFQDQTAYELKVSGKNSHHEFYKDLIKVLKYNCQSDKEPIKNFVFLTEKKGIDIIKKRFTIDIQDLIESTHKIKIILKSIN